MVKCQVCNRTGANMKMCKKCGKVWCERCACQGKAPYPKQKAVNVCPYCGGYNCMTTAK
ncbi:hypothetical protein [Butyrivibrio sp. AE3004]|uniref:hypothetical protein n=1 Tax=Butyrivibrio sp. AE3004 TaxID=1506994 RepID=UPI000B1B0EE3|nr:hypothetical protein [Butyrivibrio sp. AE3004]